MELRHDYIDRPTFAQLSQSRANNFDFLRFFMAFVVIYTHAFALSGAHGDHWRERLAHGDLGGAWIAVDFFFVISGFLITQSYLNSRSLMDYWKKRVLRIYPGFTAALIVCVFIVGPLAGVPLHEYFANPKTYAFFQPLILRDTTTLPGVFTHLPTSGMVNGSLWTIRFELMCYALVALLGTLGLLRSRRLVLALFLISIAAASAQAFDVPNHSLWTRLGYVPYFGNVYELPRFVNCFLAGMAFFVYRDRIPFSSGLLILSLIGLAVTASRWFNLTLPLFGTYILFHVAFNRRIPLKNFGRYGDFSYGLYLYAFPVEQLLVLHSGGRIHPWPLLALSFAITMVVAVSSWHLLEHPFLKLKGKRLPTNIAANGSPLHALLLTDADVFAGTERHILALACALRDQNVQASIGCPVPSPLADRARDQGINVIAIPKHGRIDWRAARQIRALVKSGRVQIVHTHNGRTALAATMGLWQNNATRLIVTQHFLDPAHTQRRGLAAIVSHLLHRRINAKAAHFIAISHAVAESIRRRDNPPAEQIVVIHNGLAACDLHELRPQAEIRAELGMDAVSPLIVCAARLEVEKDVTSLIAAMAQVHTHFPAARCVIAGEGSQMENLQSQISNLKLCDCVKLLGFRNDALSLMNAGDCFVLPSPAEPFGLVLLEAMALGKPVIATRGGPMEIIADGSGLLVPPLDPSALAAALEQILRDPAGAAAIGPRGRERFQTLFTDQKIAAATAAVYRGVLPISLAETGK